MNYILGLSEKVRLHGEQAEPLAIGISIDIITDFIIILLMASILIFSIEQACGPEYRMTEISREASQLPAEMIKALGVMGIDTR